MWQPFAPDAVRILKKALAIAANDSAPRLEVEHLYRAMVEELGFARVKSVRAPGAASVLPPVAASRTATEIRSSRLSRDARRIVDRAIKIAANRVEPRRHITGDDIVRAMSSFTRHRARR